MDERNRSDDDDNEPGSKLLLEYIGWDAGSETRERIVEWKSAIGSHCEEIKADPMLHVPIAFADVPQNIAAAVNLSVTILNLPLNPLAKSKEISQYGSTVLDTPEHIWQVTSDCIHPVNIRSIIQLHWVP